MEFQIWKVEHKGTSVPWFTYSVRQIDKVLALTQSQFSILFPEIDPAAVPEAPETKTFDIRAELK